MKKSTIHSSKKMCVSEEITKAVLALSIIFGLIGAAVYGVFSDDYVLFDRVMELTQIPLGVLIAYYFGARYYFR